MIVRDAITGRFMRDDGPPAPRRGGYAASSIGVVRVECGRPSVAAAERGLFSTTSSYAGARGGHFKIGVTERYLETVGDRSACA
jgi:hypothetical protein